MSLFMRKAVDHLGHELTLTGYVGADDEIENVALECLDCNEVLVDFDVDFDIVEEEHSKYDYVWELCPHCEEEVRLRAVLESQRCPNCNEIILPCAMCTDCVGEGEQGCIIQKDQDF